MVLCDRCKTLDAAADGYVRAEAVACAILVPAGSMSPDQATSAVLLRGSAVGQDGRSSSLTAPNGPSQQHAIRAAVQDTREALQLSQLQMHGTGTPLGGRELFASSCVVVIVPLQAVCVSSSTNCL